MGATLTKSEEGPGGYGRTGYGYSYSYGYGYGSNARVKKTESLMIPQADDSAEEEHPAESDA